MTLTPESRIVCKWVANLPEGHPVEPNLTCRGRIHARLISRYQAPSRVITGRAGTRVGARNAFWLGGKLGAFVPRTPRIGWQTP